MSPPPASDSNGETVPLPVGPTPLEAIIAALDARNAAQRVLIAELLARLAELERRLGPNSGNSGRPPSSDSPAKQPARVSSLRDRSGRQTGQQKGHSGKTLARSETLDITIDNFPAACTACDAARNQTVTTGYTTRQVFDLPWLSLCGLRHRDAGCLSRGRN